MNGWIDGLGGAAGQPTLENLFEFQTHPLSLFPLSSLLCAVVAGSWQTAQETIVYTPLPAVSSRCCRLFVAESGIDGDDEFFNAAPSCVFLPLRDGGKASRCGDRVVSRGDV
jgi:hypothetical protein